MSKRGDSRPADPKMMVRVPHQQGLAALALLKSTYGPYPPPPIKALMAALAEGAEHHARVRAARRSSRFVPLLTIDSMTFDTPCPITARKIKTNAHQWAQYYGHTIATRRDSFAGRTTVYMVQRARA